MARLSFEPPRQPLGVDRLEAEARVSRHGTVQHEILEGQRAVAFAAGDALEVNVDCRVDVGRCWRYRSAMDWRRRLRLPRPSESTSTEKYVNSCRSDCAPGPADTRIPDECLRPPLSSQQRHGDYLVNGVSGGFHQ